MSLFLLLSVIDGFEWFWIESVHKNAQLMLKFLKALFLVLDFSGHTLMTLTIFSVILLSMLMILLSIIIANKASDLWQQLELASEFEFDLRDTVDWGKK